MTLGILSDAHGNTPGFEKGLSLLRKMGAEFIVYLGDALGYLPTVSILSSLQERGSPDYLLQGNHEELILNSSSGNSAEDPAYQFRRIRSLLTPEDRAFLATLPSCVQKEYPAGVVLFIHAWNLAHPPPASVDFIFCGHTHRPEVRRQKSCQIVNVGSCGLPRDDGRYGSVALFDANTGKIRVLRYSLEQETRKLLDGIAGVDFRVKEVFGRRQEKIYGEILE